MYLKHNFFSDKTDCSSNGDGGISDQKVWSLKQCRQVFTDALAQLRVLKEKTDDKTLVWDKVGNCLFE